jgi:hypothetical protein
VKNPTHCLILGNIFELFSVTPSDFARQTAVSTITGALLAALFDTFPAPCPCLPCLVCARTNPVSQPIAADSVCQTMLPISLTLSAFFRIQVPGHFARARSQLLCDKHMGLFFILETGDQPRGCGRLHEGESGK